MALGGTLGLTSHKATVFENFFDDFLILDKADDPPFFYKINRLESC